MRRFISILLLVTILFANLSWAADTHAEAYFGHGSEWSMDKSSVPDNHETSDACDHCCHGLAHLTGLVNKTNVTLNQTVNSYFGILKQQFNNRIQSPPTPPPNA